MDQLKEKLHLKHINIEATEYAIDYLTNLGYDPQFGARPIKRVIQKMVLNELSKSLLSGEVTVEEDIVIDEFNNKIVFLKKNVKGETLNQEKRKVSKEIEE